MKKAISMLLLSALTATLFTGCMQNAEGFDGNKAITTYSREDGSGTRGAFVELFKIETKNDDGTRKDNTTKEAVIANRTDVMITNISSNPLGIGYISLGSLNDTIKAVNIDGVQASAENVKNGTYKIARPFNIATKGESEGLAKDFIDYIMSKQGQEIVSKSYIAVTDSAPEYTPSEISGKITVGGSSSVNPVMEKLKEAYLVINPNATIEIQSTDSTAGMKGLVDGICDIGMASRELKDSEKEQLTDIAIAIDGIAIIVNPSNEISGMTSEQVKSVFTGETVKWSDIK